jgi:hypothetical protein
MPMPSHRKLTRTASVSDATAPQQRDLYYLYIFGLDLFLCIDRNTALLCFVRARINICVSRRAALSTHLHGNAINTTRSSLFVHLCYTVPPEHKTHGRKELKRATADAFHSARVYVYIHSGVNPLAQQQ